MNHSFLVYLCSEHLHGAVEFNRTQRHNPRRRINPRREDKVTRSYVHGGLWGLARTFRMEERNVSLRSHGAWRGSRTPLGRMESWWLCLIARK